MAINQLKVVLSLLKEFSEGNIPSFADYDIDKHTFDNIIDAMQDDMLIKGARFSRGQGNRILVSVLDNVTITIKGMQYLNENSLAMKTYKGLKEIRDWLPF